MQIISSYAVESSLLTVACLVFTLHWLINVMYTRLRRPLPRFILRQSQAFHETSEVLLDSATYLAISVSVAGFVFNEGKPNLYEDKLSQISSILAVNAPVSILILTNNNLKRKKQRRLLVGVLALLT